MSGCLAPLSGSHQGFLTVIMSAKPFSLPNHRNTEFEFESLQVHIGVTPDSEKNLITQQLKPSLINNFL